MGKTKEQLAEDKRIAMSFRVKALDIDGLSVDDLKKKATQLWDMIVQLESDKYDLEERQKRQDYDVSIISTVDMVYTFIIGIKLLHYSLKNWLNVNVKLTEIRL